MTGRCKATFHTLVQNFKNGDFHVIGNSSVFVSYRNEKICIWYTDNKEPYMMDIPIFGFRDIRISGDGSKFFCLDHGCIQAWSTQTREFVDIVRFKDEPSNYSLIVDGSRVWVHFQNSQTQGWDFGISGSTPVPLPNVPPNKPYLGYINGTREPNTGPSRVEDVITGKEVYRLTGKYARPTASKWDGQYLVAGYTSGEVLILDLNAMIPQ